MAVFWFGWAKKLKNIFTKQQADTYYLQKELPNQLQIVKGSVDFYKNVVVKQNGYVDRVDTNTATSMINKRYLEEQTLSKTSTSAQTVAGPVNLRSPIELGTEIKAGYGGGSVKFIPEDNSTKTLQFYNNDATDTRRFNLLVPNPTAAQNPATKKYVDDKVLNSLQLQTELYHSPENVKYANVQKINVSLFDRDNISEYDPLIVSFDRYNGNDYQGTFSFVVQLNPYSSNNSNPSYGCYTQMFYNKNTTHMEIGQMCGLRLTKTYIEVSCWNSNDRIANIIVIGRDSGSV